MATQALPGRNLPTEWANTGATRAADKEANFVVDLLGYLNAGRPAPRNRAQRRELVRRLSRRKGKGFTK